MSVYNNTALAPHPTWVETKIFSGLPNRKNIVLISMGGWAYSTFEDRRPTHKTTQEIYERIVNTKEYTDLISARWESQVGRKSFLFKGEEEAARFVTLLKDDSQFKDSIRLLEEDFLVKPEREVNLSQDRHPFRKICEYIARTLCFYRLPEIPGNDPTLSQATDRDLFGKIKTRALRPDSNIIANLDWPLNQNEEVKQEEKELKVAPKRGDSISDRTLLVPAVAPQQSKVLDKAALQRKIKKTQDHIDYLNGMKAHRNTHGGSGFRHRQGSINDNISHAEARLAKLQREAARL